MKIENYYSTADTFTFPNNPNTYDDAMAANYTNFNIPYQSRHIIAGGGGVNPKKIILTGHFFGTNKNTDYQSLSKHFQENNKLKKLYFDSDKFSLGVGKEIKKTHTGGRTNFIDFVATFETVLGILLGDTQNTYTNGGAHKTNSGNVTTFVEEIAGTITNGAADTVIGDGLGNQITIPAGSGTTGQALVVTFIRMTQTGSNVYTSKYNYTTIAGTEITSVRTTAGFGIIQIAAGLTTSTISISNLDAGWTAKIRDGWSA
jgi:hypothetical protein